MPREESSRSVGGSKIDGGCVGEEEEEEEEEVWVRQRAGRPGAGGRVGVRSDSTRWREEDDQQQQQQQQSRPAAVLQQSGQVNSGEPESLPAAAAAADWQWLAHCMLQSAAPEQQPPLFGFYFCLS